MQTLTQLENPVSVRLDPSWIERIEYLAALQDITRAEQLRELIRIGGEQIGLDLD